MNANYKLTDFKTSTAFCTNSKGLTRELTFMNIISVKLCIILIDDNYAQFRGYIDRIDLISRKNWQKYASLELYHDPWTGKIHTFLDLIPSSLN